MSAPADRSLQPVIGLEIHVQLATATKLFCGDPAEYGAPPNSHVCPVCLGLPGSLPTLNARALELGVRAALGLGCAVAPISAFARKSYFYPDLPKGYQITQHDHPLAKGGEIELETDGGRTIRIDRVHLEEDSGRSLHDLVPGCTALDFNRAGVPLIEIVTAPDLRSPAEARVFLTRLRRLLRYLEVSECSMEEGSLRVDANLSLRGPDGLPGPSTEIKNVNSFANVDRALERERARQTALVEAGALVEPATLLWDDAAGTSRWSRAKESASGYRYMSEPDLPPVQVAAELVGRIRASLPELPSARERRIRDQYSLTPEHAAALTAEREIADYYESVVAEGAAPRSAVGWVLGDALAAAKAGGIDLSSLAAGPGRLAELISLVAEGRLTRPAARRVFRAMLESDASPAELAAREGLERVTGAPALESWVIESLRDHPAEAARLRAGESKLVTFFVGEVMRRSKGAADPREVANLIRRRSAPD